MKRIETKKDKRGAYFTSPFYSFFIILATLIMGIGYANINVPLGITGYLSAEAQEGIFITRADYKGNVGTTANNSEIIQMYQTYLTSTIELSKDNANSSITYEVTIYNSTNIPYAFEEVTFQLGANTYSNENITFRLDGLEYGDLLESKKSITFDITFYYKDGQLPNNNTLKSMLNFNFVKIYSITYENFSNTEGYPTYALEGHPITISLGTLDAPIEVKQSGVILNSNKYSYSNYQLTLNNVSGDIHIRKLTRYTITNLVVNGSFEDRAEPGDRLGGTYAWGVVGDSRKVGTAVNAPFGNYYAYRNAGNEGANFIIQNIRWYKGHTYYFFGYGATADRNGQEFRCNVTDWANVSGKFSVYVYGEYLKGSTRFTVDFNEEVRSISVNYATITNNVNADGIGLVDLTAHFGAGNEPSKEWCDGNINYFDGSTIVYK